jgi:predicted Zn-dependent peptidase
MKRGALALAAMLGVSACFAVPSAASESAQQQQAGALPRGGTYVLRPDASVGAAAVSLWFRAPGAGYDNATPGISRLAATAAAAAPLASGKSLVALVHSLGGDLNISVYPDIVSVDAFVPAPSVRRVVAAMTAAYFAPSIDDASVKTAQRDTAVLAVQQRYTSGLALHDLLFERLFAAGPAHYPPIPTSVAEITRLTPADIGAFAKRAFRSSNAVLALAGNVDASSLDAVTDGGGAASMDSPIDSTLASSRGDSTVTGSVDGLGLAWVGPPIADEKAATALDFVADYLFREETGVVSRALAAGKDDAYVNGQFITLHDPGVLVVTVGGDAAKSAKQRVLDELAKLETPMDARAFAAAREAFLYHLASDTQTPLEQADNLGWYAAEGNPSYAPGDAAGSYVAKARDLDPAYVAGIVRRYLKNPATVTLVVNPKESAS